MDKDLKDLILKNRSYRRYNEHISINNEQLYEFIDIARLTPSARNQQSLRYLLVNNPSQNAMVFPEINWAGYLSNWDGPVEGERQSAYIIILGIKEGSSILDVDLGISAQSILLASVELGFGGCMIHSFNRKNISQKFNIPDELHPMLIIAIGKPLEKVVIEEMDVSGDIKYWRDENQVHYVPKRSLDDLIVKFHPL